MYPDDYRYINNRFLSLSRSVRSLADQLLYQQVQTGAKSRMYTKEFKLCQESPKNTVDRLVSTAGFTNGLMQSRCKADRVAISMSELHF